MGAVSVPAFTVYAIRQDVKPMSNPAAAEVTMSWVSATTSTGRIVSARTAAPRLRGRKLSTRADKANARFRAKKAAKRDILRRAEKMRAADRVALKKD